MLRQVANFKRDTNAPTTTDTYAKLSGVCGCRRGTIASTTDEATLEQMGKWTRESVGDILLQFKALANRPQGTAAVCDGAGRMEGGRVLERAVLDNAEARLPQADKALLEGYAPCARSAGPATRHWHGSSRAELAIPEEDAGGAHFRPARYEEGGYAATMAR